MGFFDKIKKTFESKKEDVKSENIDDKNTDKSELNDKIRNFKYLDDLIHSGIKEIVLDSNIILSDNEESRYENGIRIDVDNLIIDGNGHTINAKRKARIFYCTGKNILIRNVTLKNGYTERDGGGIYNKSDLHIVCSTLSDHTAKYSGGAIDNQGKLNITKSTLTTNRSGVGGAICNGKDECSITSSTIKNNQAEDGGGIYNGINGELTINDTILNENTAQRNGGAINNHGKLNITTSTIQNNQARSGGGIENYSGEITITSSKLQNNEVDVFGGAIHNNMAAYSDKGKLSIISSRIVDNIANNGGGAIYSYGNDLKINNCEISSNISPNNIIYNENFFEIYNTKFNNNQSKYVLVNEYGESNVSIIGGEFIDNSIDDAIIFNNGKSCTIQKTIFNNDIFPNNSNDIINKTDLVLINPKMKNDTESILNEGHILIHQSQNLESKIHGEGIVETDAILNRQNFDFEYLDQKIHENKTKEIILDHDITLENYEIFFYEGGIELDIDNLIIEGNGHTIDGRNKTRIFIITGDNIILKNIKFKNGCQPDSYYNPFNISGGAIKNNNTKLTIKNCEFINNASKEYGGAIYNRFGELSLIESTLFDNTSNNDGGGIYNKKGELNISNSAFHNNNALYGGGIYNKKGELSISDSEFHNNNALYGGGIYNSGSVMSISSSTFQDNIAKYGGGGICSRKGTVNICSSILNNNTAKNDGGPSGFGGAIENHDTKMCITDSTLNNNTASFGGAIHNMGDKLSLIKSTLINNTADDGGAIDNYDGSELMILESTFKNNTSTSGGAIYNGSMLNINSSIFQDNYAYHDGGAIYNGSTLNIRISLCINNISDGDGGAIFNNSNLNIIESKFINNIAHASIIMSCGGGAIYNRENSKYESENCTFKDNKPDDVY